ncbi:MAG: Dam family site-specific DNA-(adenine-N6)-methyltransferase, partial [Vicinamibacterales bacterium]
ADGNIVYTPALAAMLIYLNRTGFNGLFRVNSSGAFNVPAGRYDRPRIADRVRVRRVADALASPGVSLQWCSFTEAERIAAAGDFLYIDPPYAPMSGTANFTSYTASRFGADEQRALQRMVVDLAHRGCHVLLSNSTAPTIADLYDGNRDTRGAGLRALRVPARRAVNSKAAGRGLVDEYLITNIEAATAAVIG